MRAMVARITSVLLIALLLAGCSSGPPPRQTWDEMRLEAPRKDNPVHLSAAAAGERATGEVILREGQQFGEGAAVGEGFDLAMRNPDFPHTYIRAVQVDVTSPFHYVRLVWTGPLAEQGPTGPYRSSPGAGDGGNNCNDLGESNRTGSKCTPKGTFLVGGFADHLNTVRSCHYVTWVHLARGVALHSHNDVPFHAASHGCIRLPYEAAKLIHNNSRAGMTLITIEGRWKQPAY